MKTMANCKAYPHTSFCQQDWCDSNKGDWCDRHPCYFEKREGNTTSRFIDLPFSEKMISTAMVRADQLGKLNNSILNGAGNFIGMLGEICVCKYYNADVEVKNFYNHDCIINGKKVEVKSKKRTVMPRKNYYADVTMTSDFQRPDLFLFVSIMMQLEKVKSVFLCGQISYSDFQKKHTFYKKGDVENGFTVTADKKSMAYGDLDECQLN